MFGLGWSEMVLLSIVALIVIGPKDLPNMFRALGQFTGKAKGMAREFSRAMEAAADESGVKDISKTVQAAANPQKFGLDKVREATGSAFKPGSETAKLSEERQAAKDRMLDASAKAVEARKAKEAAAAAPEVTVDRPAKPAEIPAATPEKGDAQ
ncbi:Sec-independent protein translocase protein TatB [Yoonia sp. R2331]|uniref:Sec-independent protein translocase protein TatB n=1 Tax=Yoonia sp. R2331 TaxID=3237238 RepID=UPI0034E42C83